MTTGPVDLADLLEVRERMVTELQRTLEANERRFLLSLVNATPERKLLDVAHLDQLPALRWKLINLAKLAQSSSKKFTEQANTLERLRRDISQLEKGNGCRPDYGGPG
jgi:hypothetical protein